MDSESGAPGTRDQQLEEAAPPFKGKKTKTAAAAVVRRWPSLVNATLVAFIMTVPPLLVILGGQPGMPAVWIKSAAAALAAHREF
ncbi:hypothetical protein ABZP36_010608 [Zizania latifolia]